MRTIRLPGTDIDTTVLGFGCNRLLLDPSPRDRRRVLEVAFELGVRHFDVARAYGLGAAEAEVGAFARGRRDELVIATKFGLEPGEGAGRFASLKDLARRALTPFPTLRQLARRVVRPPARPRRVYDAPSARASLETSLRELGTDHVDILFLHAPAPGEVRSEEVQAYLEDARQAGHIRTWGIAGRATTGSLEVAQGFAGSVPVLQVHDDVLVRTLERHDVVEPPAWITYSVLKYALPAVSDHVNASPERSERWREAVGVDCGDPDQLARLLVRYGLRANPRGVVLFSTTRPERIGPLVDEASRDPESPDPALDALLDLTSRELEPAGSVRG